MGPFGQNHFITIIHCWVKIVWAFPWDWLWQVCGVLCLNQRHVQKEPGCSGWPMSVLPQRHRWWSDVPSSWASGSSHWLSFLPGITSRTLWGVWDRTETTGFASTVLINGTYCCCFNFSYGGISSFANAALPIWGYAFIALECPWIFIRSLS